MTHSNPSNVSTPSNPSNPSNPSTRVPLAKLVLAAALLAALAGFFGSKLAPHTPTATVLFYCALGFAMVVGFVALWAAVAATFWQFVLRRGGTDSSWFWFASEPRGLQALRAEIKEGQTAQAAQARQGADERQL